MCLELKKGAHLKVALEDIKVYKRLDHDNSLTTDVIGTDRDGNLLIGNTYQFVSGIIKHKYRIGRTYRSQLNVNKFPDGRREVERGFHSFATLQGARKCKWYGKYLVECVVPKGSLYYEGSNNGDSSGIASDSIKLVKLIK